ncbi:phage tail family protein, partial [Bacillus infantis]|uniref:phage tail domain-containing protein n=1 Tax=Bacillus infantis TaxID=324767 RepID=UPI003981CD86
MSLYIESLDGFRYDLPEMGIQPLRLEIDSLTPRVESEIVDGSDGHLDTDITYEGRTMQAFFLLRSAGISEFSRLRDTVYRLFNGKTYFYIYDSRLPFKRWKVRSESRFIPDKASPGAGPVTIPLISQSPFAESSGTTLYPDPR